MVEYIERKTALSKLYHDGEWNCDETGAYEAIEAIPAVDAVKVVRCRDCKWSHHPYTDGLEKIFPGGALSCRVGRGLNEDSTGKLWENKDSLVSGDDFCSSGELKDGGE